MEIKQNEETSATLLVLNRMKIRQTLEDALLTSNPQTYKTLGYSSQEIKEKLYDLTRSANGNAKPNLPRWRTRKNAVSTGTATKAKVSRWSAFPRSPTGLG
jgi:hypothetical protein